MTKEYTFIELISGLEQKTDFKQYPTSIFFFKEEKCIFGLEFQCIEHLKLFVIQKRLGENNILNCKNAYFWCDYDKVWSIFETKYKMKYKDIQNFIKGMVEEHFKLKGVTPIDSLEVMYTGWEEHFKLKGVKPSYFHFVLFIKVEEHFKLKGKNIIN